MVVVTQLKLLDELNKAESNKKNTTLKKIFNHLKTTEIMSAWHRAVMDDGWRLKTCLRNKLFTVLIKRLQLAKLTVGIHK